MLPSLLLKGPEYHDEWMLDWLGKSSIPAMAGFTLVTIGISGNQQITMVQQDNPGVAAK